MYMPEIVLTKISKVNYEFKVQFLRQVRIFCESLQKKAVKYMESGKCRLRWYPGIPGIYLSALQLAWPSISHLFSSFPNLFFS